MSKDELHQMIDRLPDQAVDGAAILLREVSDGRIDPEQAWFWTREWQQREREAARCRRVKSSRRSGAIGTS